MNRDPSAWGSVPGRPAPHRSGAPGSDVAAANAAASGPGLPGGAVGERVLGLSEGRVRALGAEAEAWRAAAPSAERRARRWRTAALIAGGVGMLAALLR